MTETPFEVDVNDSNAWLIMGIELYHLRKDKEALQCLEKSLDLDPDLKP